MTDRAAEILAGGFERGCRLVGEGLCAIAVALRPSMDVSGCQHPEELRDHSAATMGRPRWTCTGCGFQYDAKGAA